jgi:hypothetical protein
MALGLAGISLELVEALSYSVKPSSLTSGRVEMSCVDLQGPRLEVSAKMGILARRRRTVIRACRERFTFDPPYELHTGDLGESEVYSLVFVRASCSLPVLHLAGCHDYTPQALWFGRQPSNPPAVRLRCAARPKMLGFLGVWTSCRPDWCGGLAGPPAQRISSWRG